MVINIRVPDSSDRVCNKIRGGRGVNVTLLTMIGWEMVEYGGPPSPPPILLLLHLLFINLTVNFSVTNGGHFDRNRDEACIFLHMALGYFAIVIASFCALSPLSYLFYVAFRNEIGF